jgi:hypothetical protein
MLERQVIESLDRILADGSAAPQSTLSSLRKVGTALQTIPFPSIEFGDRLITIAERAGDAGVRTQALNMLETFLEKNEEGATRSLARHLADMACERDKGVDMRLKPLLMLNTVLTYTADATILDTNSAPKVTSIAQKMFHILNHDADTGLRKAAARVLERIADENANEPVPEMAANMAGLLKSEKDADMRRSMETLMAIFNPCGTGLSGMPERKAAAGYGGLTPLAERNGSAALPQLGL